MNFPLKLVSALRALRMNFPVLILACLLAHPCKATPVQADASAKAEANSIKRYMFSKNTFPEVQAELVKRKILFATAPQAPATGRTTGATGIGASGYATPYLIDQVGGRFHVYAERRRPQHPVAPLPYLTQEVVFETPNSDVAPVGTLSYPKSGGPFPAVVLVAGSGVHDRDAGMSLHKTLLVLADHLTRQGFAVLRYDKRGVGLTGGELHPGSTTDDYAADALAATQFLKMQPNISPDQIGIIGHSEGGIIAAMVAAQSPKDVRFIVMLGGTGLPGIDVKVLQDAAARRADGMSEPLVLSYQSFERKLFQIAASKLSRTDALAAMREATSSLTAETKTALEIPPTGLPDEAFEQLLTPWFRRFFSLDPRLYLNRVNCPVLALVGDKDLQVPPVENLKEIKKALKRAAPLTTMRMLPDLNHNFQTAKTGKASEYFLIEETVAPSALALMHTWIKSVVHTRTP